MKMYGPYIRKSDGRRYVAFKTGNSRTNSKTTVKLYSRYLMEQHLDRELTKDETVDHIDRDKTNDVISNLQILSRADHARKDAKKPELSEIICPFCNNKVMKFARNIRGNNIRQGKAGPFCNKSCAGKWSRAKQLNRI